MLYLFIGILTFWYFYKKWSSVVFVKSNKITIIDLLVMMILILTWPVFVVSEIIEIIQRIRGKK